MNSVKNISIVLTAIFMAYATQALADETYTCTHGDKQRVIEIKYDVAGQSVPCEVHYTKDTGTQRLWRAEGQAGYCESKTAEFIAKQEGWGWSCDQPSAAVAETTSAAADKAGEMKEMASDVVDAAGDKAAEAKEAMSDAAGDAKAAMADKASDVADDAKAAVESAKDKAADAVSK